MRNQVWSVGARRVCMECVWLHGRMRGESGSHLIRCTTAHSLTQHHKHHATELSVHLQYSLHSSHALHIIPFETISVDLLKLCGSITK